jgi:transposase
MMGLDDMSKLISPDYQTSFLLPPSIEDWVPADHPVRFIREFVDAINVAELGFAISQSTEGRPTFAPSLMLKIWLYGYMHRIRSMRGLERACRNELPLIWLAGTMMPDHNTLWRFWHQNRKALRELFKQSVRIAAQNGLIGLAMQAVDGTKIQAAASGHKGWTKDKMEKFLGVLDQAVDQTEEEIAEGGPVDESNTYALPEALEEKQNLREAVKKGLEQLKETKREHYHPEDPEARRMKCDGRNRFGYNAQAVVDSKERIVTAAEVTNAEDDKGQLVPMLRAAEENVGQAAKQNTADGSYGSGSDLLAAQAAGYPVVAPVREGTPAGNNPYHARHFNYEPVGQTVTCPKGTQLKYQGEARQKGQNIRVYRCRNLDCPVRAQCTKDRKGRKIEIWPHTLVVQAQRAKLMQEEYRKLLKERSCVVECVFARIKQHFGFRRWTFGGLEKVQTQWSMVCLALNLRTFLTHWQRKKLKLQPA